MKLIKLSSLYSLLLLSLFAASNVTAADWPNWRGPNYDGISSENDWKTDFGGRRGPDILWKKSIGSGYSSVVVANGKLLILGLKGSKEVLSCLDAESGDVVWSHSYKTTFKPQFYDGGTSGTSTIVDDKAFLANQTGSVFCFDMSSGDVLWETDIKSELNLKLGIWGITGAPYSYGESIIVNAGKSGVALSKADGKILWSSGSDENGYATPVPFKWKGKDRVAVFGAKALYSIDPKSGSADWNYSWTTMYDVNAADPVFLDDSHVLLSSGYGKGATLIKLSDNGATEIWKNKNLRTQFNAAVLHNGYFYGVDGNTTDKGTLNCIETKTGKLVWKEKNVGSGGLILSNNHLIVITERGQLLISKASPDGFEPIIRKQVYGGKTWTVPTLANGILYCRNSRGDLVALKMK